MAMRMIIEKTVPRMKLFVLVLLFAGFSGNLVGADFENVSAEEEIIGEVVEFIDDVLENESLSENESGKVEIVFNESEEEIDMFFDGGNESFFENDGDFGSWPRGI